MRLTWLVIGVVLLAPVNAMAQEPEASSHDSEEIEVYRKAITALLGAPDSAAPFQLAARIGADRGRLLSSPAPEVLIAELTRAGYDVGLAELAENGMWQVPRTHLFVMLREIEWWPGGKIALFSIYVGTRATDTQEVAFKFRKEEDQGWVLIEKGPAESQS